MRCRCASTINIYLSSDKYGHVASASTKRTIRKNEKKDRGGQGASQINGQRIYLVKKQIYASAKNGADSYAQPEPRCQREKDSSLSGFLDFAFSFGPFFAQAKGSKQTRSDFPRLIYDFQFRLAVSFAHKVPVHGHFSVKYSPLQY